MNDLHAFEDALASRLEKIAGAVRTHASGARGVRNARPGRTAQQLRQLQDDLAVIHADLARVALIATAVAHAVVRKGVLTPAELDAIAADVDAIDGVMDGALDPAALRSPGPAAGAKPPAAKSRKRSPGPRVGKAGAHRTTPRSSAARRRVP